MIKKLALGFVFCSVIAFYLLWQLDTALDLELVLWSIRVPRMCMAMIVGATLSACGLVMQSLFKNPLASPYTLGVGAAAAFGAALGILLPLQFDILIAFLFALLLILLISLIAKRKSNNIVLLTGVLASFFFSSLIVFIQYIGDYREVFQINRWLMGSLNIIQVDSLILMTICSLVGLSYFYFKARDLDLLLLGNELASTKGVSVNSLRRNLLIVCSLLIAIAVTFCGPIAFIGLIVPNTIRLFCGALHAKTLIYSALFGALLLLISDAIARFLIYPYEIPVGIITAIIGAPWFGWLLLKKR